MPRLGPEKIGALLPALDGGELDVELYRKAGCFVLRQALPKDALKNWQTGWEKFYQSLNTGGRKINPRNKAVVNEAAPPELADMYKHTALLDIAEKICGPDLAFYFQRFLVKDEENPAPIFPHQDYGYNVGWPGKLSIFVPINPMGPENGGLMLYPGSHQYGFLGDAGEINAEAIAPDMPCICPAVEPGDVLLMHPFTWHRSEPYRRGPIRALVQICYQPADDPSGIELLRGKWQTEIFLRDQSNETMFVRSRVKRLIEMQEELDGRPKPLKRAR